MAPAGVDHDGVSGCVGDEPEDPGEAAAGALFGAALPVAPVDVELAVEGGRAFGAPVDLDEPVVLELSGAGDDGGVGLQDEPALVRFEAAPAVGLGGEGQ